MKTEIHREAEFTWVEGRTVHFSRRAVSLANTQPISEKGLEIAARSAPEAGLGLLQLIQWSTRVFEPGQA